MKKIADCEEWRDVVGYEGRYQVSNLGRVKSLARTVVSRAAGRRRQFARQWSERMMRLNGCGQYLQVCLSGDGGKRSLLVHRLVAAAFLGPSPPGMQVCHYDGNPRNNALENLRYDTPKANWEDTRRHGRTPNLKGENASKAVLTTPEALEIIALRGVLKGEDVAKRFGVGVGCVRSIWCGATWKHLPRLAHQIAPIRKTHCPRHHPYDPPNTTWHGNRRKCRTCHSANEMAKRHGMPLAEAMAHHEARMARARSALPM